LALETDLPVPDQDPEEALRSPGPGLDGGAGRVSHLNDLQLTISAKSSTAAAAVETDAAEEEGSDNGDEDEEEDYRKRNIVGRHGARQLVHF
jgi:hypothetical protein